MNFVDVYIFHLKVKKHLIMVVFAREWFFSFYHMKYLIQCIVYLNMLVKIIIILQINPASSINPDHLIIFSV